MAHSEVPRDKGANLRDVPKTHAPSFEEFLQAARDGKIERVKEFLDHPENISSINNRGPQLAPKGSWYWDLQGKTAIGFVEDRTSWERGSSTALHYAVANGNTEVVKYLLYKKADPDGNDCRLTPLLIAVCQGQEHMVKMLLEKGATPDAICGDIDQNLSALHLAVKLNFPKIVSSLLKNGADPNVGTYRRNYGAGDKNINWTPLHEAASLSMDLYPMKLNTIKVGPEVVKLSPEQIAANVKQIANDLLRYGADHSIKNSDGFTPLQEALRFTMTDKWGADGRELNPVVEPLLAYGADPSIADSDSRTPLHYAMISKRSIDVASSLLKYGAEGNSRDKLGRTPLHDASFYGQAAKVDLLLQYGADTSIADNGGMTAMGLAQDDETRLRFKESKGLNPGRKQASADKHPEEQRELLGRKLPGIRKPTVPTGMIRKWFEEHEPMAYAYICNDTNTITDQGRQYTVYDLLYGSALCNLEDNGRQCRWIHLPCNNMSWIKELINGIYYVGRKKWAMFDTMIDFVADTSHQREASQRDGYSRQPHFEWQLGGEWDMYSYYSSLVTTRKPGAERTELIFNRSQNGIDYTRFSMVLPYFDVESVESFQNSTRDKNILYQTFQSNIHMPQSLDRSYYVNLPDADISKRDQSQVLTKISRDTSSKGRKAASIQQAKQLPKNADAIIGLDETVNKEWMLTVSQLWLWRVDDRTVITAFPKRCYKKDKLSDGSDVDDYSCTLRYHIDQKLKNAASREPISAERLATIIVQTCISFFAESLNCYMDVPTASRYSQYISLQYERETSSRDKFLKAIRDGSKLDEKKGNKDVKDGADQGTVGDIVDETRCLKEVKDIRDEVNMIKRILYDQEAVLEAVKLMFKEVEAKEENKINPKAVENVKHENVDSQGTKSLTALEDARATIKKIEYDRSIYTLLRRWEGLDEDAKRIENSLNQLLDLKQKQANLDIAAAAEKQAAAAVKQADAAADEAKKTGYQNTAIFIFTAVTIIFTPLSFVTSLFALDNFKTANPVPGQALGGTFGGTVLALFAIIGWVLWQSNRQPKPTAVMPPVPQIPVAAQEKKKSAVSLVSRKGSSIAVEGDNYV